MTTKPVAFLMGSDSDLTTIEGALALLDEFGVGYHVRVLSAHRTPDEAAAFAREAESQGIKVLIGVAGLAAHLAGALAAHSLLPVLGVPAANGPLQGHDALLSTVMMPPGVPVGTLAIGAVGAKNAALLAVRILALSDKGVADRLRQWRAAERDKSLSKDRVVRERFSC
jgi:phosphoribosylaminoimidazole carboxylase PurE protein